MEVDISCSITGQKSGAVKGESTRKGREGLIDLDSWSWGMQRPTEYGGLNAGGQAVGAVVLKVLSFTKLVDGASCAMMSMLNGNEIITSCELSCYKSGPNSIAMLYFKITLSNARFINFDVENGSKDIASRETWSLGFEKIRCDYTVQADDGQKRGSMSFSAQTFAGSK